jgi:hypothetical protein
MPGNFGPASNRPEPTICSRLRRTAPEKGEDECHEVFQ